MTVQQLIDQLQQVTVKDRPVMFEGIRGESFYPIELGSDPVDMDDDYPIGIYLVEEKEE